jgi:hypothetical protein
MQWKVGQVIWNRHRLALVGTIRRNILSRLVLNWGFIPRLELLFRASSGVRVGIDAGTQVYASSSEAATQFRRHCWVCGMQSASDVYRQAAHAGAGLEDLKRLRIGFVFFFARAWEV